jgi:hypothetical protein
MNIITRKMGKTNSRVCNGIDRTAFCPSIPKEEGSPEMSAPPVRASGRPL